MPAPIIMPRFGMTQESAVIVEWLAKPGQAVRKGDPLLSVETDKVVMDVESPGDGILDGVRFGPGAEVPVTEVIAYLLAPGEAQAGSGHDAAVLRTQATQSKEAGAGPEAGAPASPVARRVAEEAGVDLAALAGERGGRKVWKADVEAYLERQGGPSGGARPAGAPGAEAADGPALRASPAARRLGRELGMPLEGIQGSGPRGRVQAADVQAAAASGSSTTLPHAPATRGPWLRYGAPAGEESPGPGPQAAYGPAQAGAGDETQRQAGELRATGSAGTPGGEQVRRFAGMRKSIARRMLRNYQTVPHITLSVDVDMRASLDLHARLEAAAPEGLRVSLTALLVKVAAWALMRHPEINAHVDDEETRLQAGANIGVAVALTEGLIVPVIKAAQNKGVHAIAAELNDLAGRAASGRLTPDDVSGGTFTISNLGMFGIDRFTAIINAPEAAILAVGRVAQRIVPDEAGQPAARPIMTLTLSVDHRAIDGAAAARFLADLRRCLEEPGLLVA